MLDRTRLERLSCGVGPPRVGSSKRKAFPERPVPPRLEPQRRATTRPNSTEARGPPAYDGCPGTNSLDGRSAAAAGAELNANFVLGAAAFWSLCGARNSAMPILSPRTPSGRETRGHRCGARTRAPARPGERKAASPPPRAEMRRRCGCPRVLWAAEAAPGAVTIQGTTGRACEVIGQRLAPHDLEAVPDPCRR